MPTPEEEYSFHRTAQERIRMEKLARRILGVDSSADDTEIKRAYWLLAMKHHPDKNPNDKQAEKQFQNIQNAYEFLIKKRDRLHVSDDAPDGETPISEDYNTDNDWGYFLWWRDKYFQ